jgi:hypothetical protein
MAMQCFASPERPGRAYAYEIFLNINPSVIFNMNLDGYARSYRHGHIYLEPHGTIPGSLVHSPLWEEIVDNSIQYNFEPPKLNGLVLPQRESAEMTRDQVRIVL